MGRGDGEGAGTPNTLLKQESLQLAEASLRDKMNLRKDENERKPVFVLDEKISEGKARETCRLQSHYHEEGKSGGWFGNCWQCGSGLVVEDNWGWLSPAASPQHCICDLCCSRRVWTQANTKKKTTKRPTWLYSGFTRYEQNE